MTHDMILTRVFDAPPERVWEAWKDPAQVMRWWGPEGFTSPLARMDFRVGGKSLVCMRSPDGYDMYNTWSYSEITPIERIAYVLNFTDADGNAFPPSQIGMPAEIPHDVRHLITFRASGANKTELTVTEYGYGSAEVMEMSKLGMAQCLDKMAALLAEE